MLTLKGRPPYTFLRKGLIQQAYRYELKPNNEQKTLLAKHAGCARFAYNWALACRIEEYKQTGKSSNAIEQHRQLNTLKKTDFPWMHEVSKCAPQEALRDLDRAFNNFYRGLKSEQKTGFPKFKKKGIHDSFRLTGSIHVFKRSVKLPRLGRIRTKEFTDLKGHILSATVCKEADRWFVSFAVERKREEYRVIRDSVIGVDVGINCFAVLSDGRKIESPKPLNSALNLLKRRSKQHSRKKLGSTNRKKSALRLARLHYKIRNRRKDFLHKLSTTLAKTKQVVVIEELIDLCISKGTVWPLFSPIFKAIFHLECSICCAKINNVKGMMQNSHLSRHIADSGWNEFSRMLSYKTKWYSSSLVKAPKFYPSSKICSVCGAIKPVLNLSDRKFICEICGAVIDRDENAARNLECLLTTGSSPGRDACGDTSGGGTPMQHRGSTSHVSLNQEANTKYSHGIFG